MAETTIDPRTVGTRRWWALGALVIAVLAVGIDVTILSVALPTLASQLDASTSQLQWFVSAYTLVFAAAMIPGGMLGDRFGRKRLLLIALVVFGAGSLACAYAPSANAFIAARAVLGLGGAIVLPMALAVLPAMFPTQERGRALATMMAATMLGFPLGPILGGWLLVHYSWGTVFLINVPVVVVALVAVGLLLAESRSSERPRLDPVGIAASSAGLTVLVYGVIEAGRNGAGDTGALAAGGAGLVVLAAFVAWERRVREPLVDLSLFGSPGFTWSTILMTAVSFAMFGVLFAAPQYFQAVLGEDALGSGVRLVPLAGGMIAGAGAAVALARRVGAKAAVGLGFALLTAGMCCGAATSVTSAGGWAAGWIAICGLGLGFAMPTAMDIALGELPPERTGVGSALLQAARMVGGSLGAALLGSVVNAGYRARVDVAGLPSASASTVKSSVTDGVTVAHHVGSAPLLHSVRAAFVHGMDLSLLVCAALAAAGLVLAVSFLPQQARSGAQPARRRDALVAD
jgi:DHA2 family multidrug resistance protein-like MFS transporter